MLLYTKSQLQELTQILNNIIAQNNQLIIQNLVPLNQKLQSIPAFIEANENNLVLEILIEITYELSAIIQTNQYKDFFHKNKHDLYESFLQIESIEKNFLSFENMASSNKLSIQ